MSATPPAIADVPAGDRVRLDIACGSSAREGFVGMDVAESADLVHDPAVLPWPLADEAVAEAFCAGYVHRVQPVGGSGDGLIAFMAEVHRVLAPDATIRIQHPYAKTDRALQDPSTTRVIPDATWWYFDREWRDSEGVGHDLIRSDFEVVSIESSLQAGWDQRSAEARAFALRHYWNVVGDLDVVLRARKTQ